MRCEQQENRLGALQLPIENLLPLLAGSDACGGIKVQTGSLEALIDQPLPQGARLFALWPWQHNRLGMIGEGIPIPTRELYAGRRVSSVWHAGRG